MLRPDEQLVKPRAKSQQHISEDKVICASAGAEGGAPGSRYSLHSLMIFVTAVSVREVATQSMESGLAMGQKNCRLLSALWRLGLTGQPFVR